MRIELCGLLRSTERLAEALGAEIRGPITPLCGIATHSDEVRPGDLFVALQGKNESGLAYLERAFLMGAVGAIAPRAACLPAEKLHLAVEDVAAALLHAAAYRRRMSRAFVIAISGSTGKTTAKEGIVALLRRKGSVCGTAGNFNSSVGFPLTLLSFEESDYFVVELGISHVGEMAAMASCAMPDLALLTNVGTAHLGQFGDRSILVAEKLKLTAFLSDRGKCILPISLQNEPLPCARERVLWHGAGGQIRLDNIVNTENGVRGDLTVADRVITNIGWQVPGRSGAAAATVIAGVGALLGIEDEALRHALWLAGERTPRMQMRWADGYLLIDDCYNASPDSVEGALEALFYRARGRQTVAVLGDMLELGAHSRALHLRVGRAVAEQGIGDLFTLGEQAKWYAEGAIGAGMSADRVFCFAKDEKEALISALKARIPRGAVVLLKGSGGMRMRVLAEMLGG